MKVIFELSGATLFETEMNHVPTVGSVVTFRTQQYKSGLYAGSLISVEITDEDPIAYDLSDDKDHRAYISSNGYKLIEEGPQPKD